MGTRTTHVCCRLLLLALALLQLLSDGAATNPLMPHPARAALKRTPSGSKGVSSGTVHVVPHAKGATGQPAATPTTTATMTATATVADAVAPRKRSGAPAAKPTFKRDKLIVGAHATQNGLSHKKPQQTPLKQQQQAHTTAHRKNGKHARKSLLEQSEMQPSQKMSLAVLDGDYVVYPQKKPAHSLKATVTASGENADGSSTHSKHSTSIEESSMEHISSATDEGTESSQTSSPKGAPLRRHSLRHRHQKVQKATAILEKLTS